MSVDLPAIRRLPLTLVTCDGERLAALHLPRPDRSRELAVIVAHGFSGSLRKPAVRAVAAALAPYVGVLAFDFRGHGDSSGVSTLGDREIYDVDAAVISARGWATGGWSPAASRWAARRCCGTRRCFATSTRW